jgi:hypothetical protein
VSPIAGSERALDRPLGAGSPVVVGGLVRPWQDAGIETELRHVVGDAVAASLAAGLLSGAPSTTISMVRHDSLVDSTRAAGTLLGRPSLIRGVAAHAAITAGWSLILSAALPRRRTLTAGVAAGGVIAALDLGLVGRRVPAIRALDQGPQVLDHLAFGVVAAAVIARRRRRRAAASNQVTTDPRWQGGVASRWARR